MTVDLIIKDGTIFTPSGVMRCNIAVDDSKIVSLVSDSKSPNADRIIDCAGKLVLPGIIDPHVHFRDPGYIHKEDYESGSRAAAAGGITMVMDQPNTDPVPNTLERFEAHKENAGKKSLIDFNHFASPGIAKEVPKIAALGAIAFKIFQKKAAYPYDTEASIADDYRIFEAFEAVGKTNRICSIHAHETDFYEESIRLLKEKGDMSWQSFIDVSYSEIVRVGTVPTLIYLAEKAGVRLYALHCGSRDYIDIIRGAKAAGKNVIADCEFSHLVPAPRGSKPDILKGQYWTNEEHVKATWQGLFDGTIDFIDSDHAPHKPEEIEIGLEDPEKMALGYGCIEYYFPLLLNEVNRGRISVEQLVNLCSTNVAKIFDIYPRKGALQVGSDADITIVDPKKTMTITSENLHTKAGWTAYEGYEVTGVPVFTIIRGNIVMEDGDVIGKPGYGEFIRPIH
ncbi:MAG: dihydroorotase [Candidatus Thorarchaeota archaeon]|jgi:dihydroorotase (multifunctional complex type)